MDQYDVIILEDGSITVRWSGSGGEESATLHDESLAAHTLAAMLYALRDGAR